VQTWSLGLKEMGEIQDRGKEIAREFSDQLFKDSADRPQKT
jgi:hypothetical protein